MTQYGKSKSPEYHGIHSPFKLIEAETGRIVASFHLESDLDEVASLIEGFSTSENELRKSEARVLSLADSRRDHFAGLAMQAFIAMNGVGIFEVARVSYEYADAMIEQGGK